VFSPGVVSQGFIGAKNSVNNSNMSAKSKLRGHKIEYIHNIKIKT